VSGVHCHICRRDELALDALFADFKRVTSDCRPWAAGGQLGACTACGTAQARIDDQWRGECRQIYESYAIYYQGGGAEQKVFDSASGASASRSDQLLEQLKSVVTLPEAGRLVDVGCGNGNFLRSFSRRFPNWRLLGSEFDETHRATVEAIPGVEGFFSRDASQLPDGFDAISLIHVLEHIEEPQNFLTTLRGKLRPGGYLVIELPLFTDNPFELLIADHATHFEPATIEALLARTDFAPVSVTTEWIPKELSVLACAESTRVAAQAQSSDELRTAIAWLGRVRDQARGVATRSSRFGIFGTSIGATWLWSELGGNVAFFVDEDSNRAGGTHFDLPIYHPANVPADSSVYVALPPKISRAVTTRLSRADRVYHSTPDDL
jgi:SAM-dependent methyltransferase